MTEVKLPSGALLKITPAPFADAKALYQAILKEAKGTKLDAKTDMTSFFKDMFCGGFSSEDIESKLWVCFKRCLYNSGAGDFRIEQATFEPVEARRDYMKVCMEVTKENVLPFAQDLYAEYSRIIAMIESTPESK